MRSPVYRNLDQPFEILGFSVAELTSLCFVLVAGGELLKFFGFNRLWAFLLTMVLAFALFWLRRSLGENFSFRMLRYLSFPNRLQPKLVVESKNSEEANP